MLKKILLILLWIVGTVTAAVLILLLALYVGNSGDYSVLATTEDDPGLPVIQIGDYPFHGEVFGNAENPVIITLHGGPGGDYRSILPLKKLSDEYRVVFYDQRGSGLSPRVSKDELTLDRYIADLNLLIDRFSPDSPVILIGHSWGAMLASAYIGQYPGNVSKAVLAEPGFLDHHFMEIYNQKTGLTNMKPSSPVLAALLEALGESMHVKGPDSQARLDYFVFRYFTTPIPENPIAGYYKDGNIENAAGEAWRFGGKAATAIPASGLDNDGRLVDLAAGVDQWPGTALFISGSENSIIGPDHQTQQMKRFPRARLEVIEGAGHTMIGEKTEQTLKVIRAYLKAGTQSR